MEVPPVEVPPIGVPALPGPVQPPSIVSPPSGGGGGSSQPAAGGNGASGVGSPGRASLGRATRPRSGGRGAPADGGAGGASPAPASGLGRGGARGRSPGPALGTPGDLARRGRADGGYSPSRPDGRRSLPERIGSAIAGVPWQLMAAMGALALLGLLMAVRSALSSLREARLRRQSAELRGDVGALQAALLPSVPEQMGNVALSLAYKPAEGPAAGGDFHDVVPLGDGRFGVIVGDVSGHGRDALAATALVHYTVRAYLTAGLEPRLALRLTDQVLDGSLGDDFATVLAATYDPAASTLSYATAGHPAPIVIGDRSRPRGRSPDLTADRHRTVHGQSSDDRLRTPGSRICLFTDGLTESRGEDESLLERDGLIRILERGGRGPRGRRSPRSDDRPVGGGRRRHDGLPARPARRGGHRHGHRGARDRLDRRPQKPRGVPGALRPRARSGQGGRGADRLSKPPSAPR